MQLQFLNKGLKIYLNWVHDIRCDDVIVVFPHPKIQLQFLNKSIQINFNAMIETTHEVKKKINK